MRARPFTGFPEAFRALPAHADAAYNVPEYDLAPAELRAVLLIAATPRVGSNLLGDGLRPVSYTHLTLPTILRV